MFLLLNDGKTQAEIANFLGCSLRKVAYWCVHGAPDNLESLMDERMKGNYQKATEEYIKLLLDTIEKEPEELGYKFGRWTNARLSTYLEEKTGIKLSSGQIRNILKKIDIRISVQNIVWKKSKIVKKEKHLKKN